MYTSSSKDKSKKKIAYARKRKSNILFLALFFANFNAYLAKNCYFCVKNSTQT